MQILIATAFALLTPAARADEPKSKPAASELLAEALASAKKDGKAVFLAFGSPSCGWCKHMDKFHARPEVASTLGKYLVFVKVDIVENAGAAKLYDKYAPEPGGVPVWVIMDADGKVLADSFAEATEGKKKKANVGFPYEPAELAHYEKALRTALPKATDSEVVLVMKELKDSGPKKVKKDDK